MASLGAHGNRKAVRPASNNFQRKIGLMTVHPHEQAHILLVVPDGEVGVIGVDLHVRIDLRILRSVIRHRNNAGRDTLRQDLNGLGFFGCFLIPIPEDQRSGMKRGVFGIQELPSGVLHRLLFRNNHPFNMGFSRFRKHNAHPGCRGCKISLWSRHHTIVSHQNQCPLRRWPTPCHVNYADSRLRYSI